MAKRIIFADTPEVREEIEAEVWANPGKFCLEEEDIHNGEKVMQAIEDHVDWLRHCKVIDLIDDELPSYVVAIVAQATSNGGSSIGISRVGHYVATVADRPLDGLFFEEEVFADEQDVRWRGRNAYGKNTAIFRILKDNAQYDAFLQALARVSGMPDGEDKEMALNGAIAHYTKSILPEVAAVLEW